jgi:large subunit ribosomal protein L22
MDVVATMKYARMSASKGRQLAGMIQGLPVNEALKLTDFGGRKAATLVGKTLKSAIANATNNAKLAVESLRVKEAVVNEGARLRRHWPRARGSVSPICKRTCHVRIVVTDGAE